MPKEIFIKVARLDAEFYSASNETNFIAIGVKLTALGRKNHYSNILFEYLTALE